MIGDDLYDAISKVAAFRPGPYEVYANPDDVATVREHTDVLARWDATVVPSDDVEPGEFVVFGRPAGR